MLLIAISTGDVLAQASQYTVKHPPRIQLGDAPLKGYPGSKSDQVQIIWQTVSVGSGTLDTFEVHYRALGDGAWVRAGTIEQVDTGHGSRINHFVDITDLAFYTLYEYRVRHFRAASEIASWNARFRTRLTMGDSTPFSFAAYGDSAYTPSVSNFRRVQDRINIVDPAFALLLGDNCYQNGGHSEMDARFDDDINPEAHAWTAEHIDYLSLGNHDVGIADGRASEDNFSVPIPVAGITALFQPPSEEYEEHNYGFDYGMAHFMTFDTNSLNDPERLDGQLTYIKNEMAIVTSTWKIVYGHHPVGGGPDKSEEPRDDYFRQVVPRLRAAGVDLFLVGHSHTFSWTYAMIGGVGGHAIYLDDRDKDYAKGAGLIQVISGMGGKSLRSGNFAQFPFIAQGFSTSTSPSSEYGTAIVDVTETQLTVRYVAANDGIVLDQFTITEGPRLPLVSVQAIESAASETEPNIRAFRLTRDDSVGGLTVRHSVSGSATEGVDYEPIGDSTMLVDGVATADVMLHVLDDEYSEGAESVVLTIDPTEKYATSPSFSAAVTILDDESSDVTVRISHSSDDAEEQEVTGAVYLDSTDVELTDDPTFNGDQITGLRFASVVLPLDASISNAYIEFTADEVDSTPTYLQIYGHAADNSPTFSEAVHDLSGRARTSATVYWDNLPPWDTVGVTHRSPDLTPLVREITGRAGWTSGNALTFMFDGSGERTAEAYDGTVSLAPSLRIFYRTGPTNTPTPTASSTPEPTPAPTAAPSPTVSMPTATPTPAPTPVTEPTRIPEPTAVPAPAPTTVPDITSVIYVSWSSPGHVR